MQTEYGYDIKVRMKQTLTIRVAKRQLETLREIAKAEDESISAIIRGMVDDGIKKRNKKKHFNKNKI